MNLHILMGDCKMGTFRGLWVDDIRPIPDNLIAQNWCSARSAWEALLKLELLEFDVISLDHDLASRVGNKELTGWDILVWLVQRKVDGQYVPSTVNIHTANCAASPNMIQLAKQHFICDNR